MISPSGPCSQGWWGNPWGFEYTPFGTIVITSYSIHYTKLYDIKLRSMLQILNFLANGIRTWKEFDVAPDSRTGEVARSPSETLKINVTGNQPENVPEWVYYDGRYYSVV